jgi:hypothetical protein
MAGANAPEVGAGDGRAAPSKISSFSVRTARSMTDTESLSGLAT